MTTATRTSVVMGAGIGGFFAAGPVGAAACGVTAGASYDGLHSALKGKAKGNFGAAFEAQRRTLRVRLEVDAAAALTPAGRPKFRYP